MGKVNLNFLTDNSERFKRPTPGCQENQKYGFYNHQFPADE